MASEADPDRGRYRSVQARGWARVARASSGAYRDSPGPRANAALFDAIEYAATEARLGMGDLVDAYLVGAPQLDMHEAWEDVEGFLERIARVHAGTLDGAFARIDRALPDWRRRLALRIAAHDLALAAQRAFGDQDERIDITRRAVADVLEGACAADVTEGELDAYIAALRVEQCDLGQVIVTAAWIAGERARLAQRRGNALPRPAWAAVAEIAEDRGVAIEIVAALIDDAVHRGLLAGDGGGGVTVTPTGHEYLAAGDRGVP